MSKTPTTVAGKTPWEFACGWYHPDEIQRSIAKRHFIALFEAPRIPPNIDSREFAVWLTHQYRLAMQKGITIALNEWPARIAEVEAERLRKSWQPLAHRRDRHGRFVPSNPHSIINDFSAWFAFECAYEFYDSKSDERRIFGL